MEGPESVGLTRKLEQVYGLILDEDDDDELTIMIPTAIAIVIQKILCGFDN